MKKNNWGIGILIVLILAAWYVIDSKENKVAVSKDPIKIGIVTVLTGDFAGLGENIVNSARLQVDEINKNGGVQGRPIELIIEDSGITGKTALSAGQKLIDVDKVKYIIGGAPSNGTLAIAPVANKNKVVYITPLTGGSNIDDAGDYVFRLANSDILGGKDIAEAMATLKYKKVAVVAETTDYTLDLKKSFESTVPALGGKVVVSEEFQPGTTDFRTILTKIKNEKPEAIFIASQTGVGGALLVKQMREVAIDIPIFSDFTFVLNDSAKKLVGSFEGVYFADPAYNQNNKDALTFFAKYKEIYGKNPLIPFHTAATHDSISLLVKAISEVGDDSSKVQTWLSTDVKNYNGFMGIYSLDAKGNSNLGFTVKKIVGNDFVPVK